MSKKLSHIVKQELISARWTIIMPGGGLFSLYKGSPALEIYGDYIQASTQVAGVARPDRL
jgi:hypothetical protein